MLRGDRSGATLGHLLETTRPPLESIRTLLDPGSSEPALVHAAVLHIDRRFRHGEAEPAELAELLPADPYGWPWESQLVVAALAVDGLPFRVPPAPTTLPPAVYLAWLRAELLQDPAAFPRHEQSPTGREAIEGLPVERVIASGLVDRLLTGAESSTHRVAIDTIRQGLERGLLDREQAQTWLLGLARRSCPAVAAAALQLLQCSWAFGLTLPPLRFSAAEEAEVQLERVGLAKARRAADQLRQLLREGTPFAAVDRALIAALGAVGAAHDVDPILTRMAADPFRKAGAGLEALVLLKRRGVAATANDADRLVELYLEHAALDPARTAEVLSSHADRIAAAMERNGLGRDDGSRTAALLEAFGTRGAIARLRSILSRADERAGWWHAARALGRLGATEAEPDVLRCLADEPDACLFALGLIGGDETIRVLADLVSRDDASAPTWLGDAARLLFLLAPSMEHVDALERRGHLTPALLQALPAHGEASRSPALRRILRDDAHPLRRAAIQALGRTGGPLALDWLGQLLTDPDAEIRREAIEALHTLGRRLRDMRSARPAHLAPAHPGEFAVAEAVVRRLREKDLDTDQVVRLLDAMPPTGHPQLIPVVRPYLRSRDPEIQKRVLTCLAAAGPAAAAWILPWVSDDDITVSRQAVLALARVGARGLAQPIAAWLDHRNMNLKKTAAEALAAIGDESSAAALLGWLAAHDNPGFRELLVDALRASAGPWVRCLLIAGLRRAASPRAAELLTDALAADLSAEDVASLAARWSDEAWTETLIERFDRGPTAARTSAELDAELRRRGLAHRIPRPQAIPADAGDEARAAEAARAGTRLQAALRALAGGAGDAELPRLLHRANKSGQMTVPALSSAEVHALLDELPRLDPEATRGAHQVLAAAALDSIATARAADLVRRSDLDELPAPLVRTTSRALSVEAARRELASTDPILRAAAARTLALAGTVDDKAWPESEAPLLVAHAIRERSYDACFEWCRRAGRLRGLTQTLTQTLGATATAERVRAWMASRPDAAASLLHELVGLGPAGQAELERLVRSTRSHLHQRELALTSLAAAGAADPALLRDLLQDEHAALREAAARALLRAGDRADRALLVQRFLDGAFREEFAIDLEHGDLPTLEPAVGERAPEARRRLVRLVERLDSRRRVPLLLELARDGDDEVRARARDALRSRDPGGVLPFLIPLVRSGDESMLDVLGPTSSLPTALVATWTDSPAWTRFLERMANGGPLHAPGLAEALTRGLDQDPSPATCRLLVSIGDWSTPSAAARLASALRPALSGPDRDRLLGEIVEAIAARDPARRAEILSRLGTAADRPVVVALVDAVLARPSLAATLEPPMRTAVNREMESQASGRDPERIRKLLSYRAARADTATEREELAALLEQSMAHSSPRVRLHAHRLLRVHTDRPRYLRATRVLLRDPDRATVRSAIRVLSYGGDLEVVEELADLVSHRDPSIRKAAAEGLTTMGKDALPPLLRAIKRARPDHREALTEIRRELESPSGPVIVRR